MKLRERRFCFNYSSFFKGKTSYKFFWKKPSIYNTSFIKPFERKRPKETEMVIKSTNQVKKTKTNESSQNFKKKQVQKKKKQNQNK
jgi:hypothetical protein